MPAAKINKEPQEKRKRKHKMEIKIKRKAKSAVICDEIEIDKRDPQVRETNSPNGHAMSGRVWSAGGFGGGRGITTIPAKKENGNFQQN